MWQTAWTLGAGHELKLEITPNDAPTWRADDLPSTVALSHLSLTLPTHS